MKEIRGWIMQKHCARVSSFAFTCYIATAFQKLIDIVGIRPNAVLGCWSLFVFQKAFSPFDLGHPF
jgi:hypothetical protein